MKRRLQQLANTLVLDRLAFCNGIEKENLRIDRQTGQQALTDHPAALGASLTNAFVTTDFSENLIEMVTTPVADSEVLHQLTQLNRFVITHLERELLWPLSMPGWIEDIQQVREARYGSSNIAKMKHIYRVGLKHRYGKMMQLIAGVHCNVSLPNELFQALHIIDSQSKSFKDFISDQYLRLVYHFYCHYPLLIYLFGASPSCTVQSLPATGVPDYIQKIDQYTCLAPHGVSLRMSDLGYQNPRQDTVKIDYRSVEHYANSLVRATQIPYPAYVDIGVKQGDNYKQLNCNWLQIENEYYSPIRPKQICHHGERPAVALRQRGIAYVEVRAIDLNPLHCLSVDSEQIKFVNLFILWCLLTEKTGCLADEACHALRHNFYLVATQGRKPGLKIEVNAKKVLLSDWMRAILAEIYIVAQWLDQQYPGADYCDVLTRQMVKAEQVDLTPSAKVLVDMQQRKLSHHEYGLCIAGEQAQWLLKQSVDQNLLVQFQQAVLDSTDMAQQIASVAQKPFEQYLADYFRQV